MYHLWRKIHLFTGVALLAFVLLYFVSGWVIVHGDWFPRDHPTRTTRQATLPNGAGLDPQAYSQLLQNHFALAGKRQPPTRAKDGTWKFVYLRPGVTHELVIPPAANAVRITTSTFNAAGTLNAFHRLHGYGGGRLYDLWALLYDLTSASLILFAVSGIYLWFKLTRRRRLGWALLALSFGFTATTLATFVLAT